MAEENRPQSTALPAHLVKVQCITGVMPWAEVHINAGGTWQRKDKFQAEPLQIDQVAVIPRDKAYERMLKNRHIVRFAED